MAKTRFDSVIINLPRTKAEEDEQRVGKGLEALVDLFSQGMTFNGIFLLRGSYHWPVMFLNWAMIVLMLALAFSGKGVSPLSLCRLRGSFLGILN
ncbi:hypothetical protein LINGRAPRIM_LOCUS253, partial [Linum grandiflorum]